MADRGVLERIQAPTGGLNEDASPDYVGATQAPYIENLLPGLSGKVVCRGPISSSIGTISAAVTNVTHGWMLDDLALLQLADGTTQKADLTALTAVDVSATIGKVPVSSAHARYGANIYGAVTDATHPPALGAWSGGAAALQTNAPYGFIDVQNYAQRLFVLGGSVPGTTTPAKPRTLYWTDLPTTAGVYPDLTLTASWSDDVSGLVNQIVLDVDDTPVALASCGRYMAIIGTNSINILTGSGSSSFAVRNLTKNWGAINLESVVEVNDGFYFLSTRGYCFCDGSSVLVVSDQAVTTSLLRAAASFTIRAAMLNNGYLALSLGSTSFLLFHIASRTWAWMNGAGNYSSSNPVHVFRTSSYPFFWQGRSIWRCERLTTTGLYTLVDQNQRAISPTWRSREVRLGSSLKKAVVRRVVVDYAIAVDSGGAQPQAAEGWLVTVVSGAFSPASLLLPYGMVAGRQRAVIDVNAELDTMQVLVTWTNVGTSPDITSLEMYDIWVEYEQAQDTAGF